MRRGLLLSFTVCLVACTERAPPPPRASSEPAPAHPTATDTAPAVGATEKPARAPAAVAPTPPPPSVALLPLPRPPERGCLRVQDSLLREGEARGWLEREDGRLLAVLSPQAGGVLESWAGPFGALARRATLELSAPAVQLTLQRVHARTWVAWTDARMRLSLVELKGGRFGTPRVLAEGVDRRFAPSLAWVGEQLIVAFTRTADEVMHTMLARVRGETVQVEDITPPGHGAAAATFVQGIEPPSLVMIDAHAGMSPLLEVVFERDGRANGASVRTPVSQPYAPPLLAAVALDDTHVEVAFTAIGRAAATAVGRVPLRSPEAPVALVPSKGYGELRFTSLQAPGAALFALEDAKAATANAGREILLKRVDIRGEGPALQIRDETASVSAPSLARGELPGELFLAYSQGASVRLARLACDF